MSDSAELEREAEAARARLSDTAEQLRARMSPGQMMDEVLTQFRGGDTSQLLSNFGAQARDNPMALALVGSGIAWLMMGSRPDHKAASDAVTRPRPEMAPQPDSYPGTGGMAYNFPSGGGESGFPSGRDASGGVAETATGAMASARDAVTDRLHAAGEALGGTAHDLADQGNRMVDDLKAAGSDSVEGLRHTAADLGTQARTSFFDMLEREPLVIGALGVAVGAAIGALLPTTALERQHLAPASGALKEKADALVDRGMTAAKQAAADVYASAKDEADRQGLLPEGKPVAQKLDSVMRAAGETVATALNEAVDPKAGDVDTRDGDQPRPSTPAA